MASEGPNSPSTLSENTSIGSRSWTDEANAASSNNSYAYADGVKTTVSSYYLTATGFGFALPSGATVDGIVAEIERYRDPGGFFGGVIDNSVRIIKGGTIGSTGKASGTSWPTSDTVASYGSSSDLWGETWSYSDINASDFGLALSIKGTSTTGGIGYVDHIKITVYYTELGKTGSASSTMSVSAARAVVYVESGSASLSLSSSGWRSGRDYPGHAETGFGCSGSKTVISVRAGRGSATMSAAGQRRGVSALSFHPAESAALTLTPHGSSSTLTMEAHDPSSP